MNTTPVKAGEPVKPRITAEWFNSTLPVDKAGVKTKLPRTIKEEGELLCYVPPGTLAAPVQRHNPLAIKFQVRPEDEDRRLPTLTETDIDEYNWCVLQETAVNTGAPRCVISGPTRAFVHDTGLGKRVTYNTTTQRLETSTRGKGQMLVQETTFASLINISNVFESQIIRFQATSNMSASHTFTADVISSDSSLAAIGTSITVHDTYNLFPEIKEHCVGTAQYVIEEDGIARWEVITTSLPITKMVIHLKDHLYVTDSTGQGLLADIEYRSSYPDVLPPQEIQDDLAEITFINRWKLEGVKDSPAIIERQSNKSHQSIDPYTLSETRETNFQWELIKVRDIKARWITVVYNQSTNTVPVVSSWEGVQPDEDQTIFFPNTELCLQDGAKLTCCYNPEADTYGVVNADKNVHTKTIQVVDGEVGIEWSSAYCGNLEYATRTLTTIVCGPAPDSPAVPVNKIAIWGGTVQPVLVSAFIGTDSYDNNCLAFTRAYALVCASTTIPDPILLCGTTCPCTSKVHYKRYVSPGDIPPEAVYVGDYTDGYLTDAVAEQCFEPAEAPEGWVEGLAATLGVGYVANGTPSPVCCEPVTTECNDIIWYRIYENFNDVPVGAQYVGHVTFSDIEYHVVEQCFPSDAVLDPEWNSGTLDLLPEFVRVFNSPTCCLEE